MHQINLMYKHSTAKVHSLDKRRIVSQFADRLKDIQPFRVMDVLAKARALERQGKEIIHMEVGEPDFSTAGPVIEAGQQALRQGYTHYTPAAGLPQLRESIARYYQQEYGVDVAPDRIFITPGASGALLLAAALLVNPGDGVLLTDPGYPCNRHFLRLVEGDAQLIPVAAQDCFQLSACSLQQYWQANTVAAMVASPANPTGEIIPRDQLFELYDAVAARQGYLLVDEIYHGLSYGLNTPTILEHTDEAFVINSFSKYFGMTGWRVGWLVAPESAVAELDKLAQNFFLATSTIAQYAALEAFSEPSMAIHEQRRAVFAERRDFLLPELRRLGFEIPHTPSGAFYLYANIEKFNQESLPFCDALLNEAGIAITPGEDFGHYLASKHVRFSYTTEQAQLEQAVSRLQKWLA
jgi:aspartate/methionine/tyrosine aminotransferase